MPEMDLLQKQPHKRKTYVIFVIDASSKMDGVLLTSLNRVISNLIEGIKEYEKNNIKKGIAAIEFNEGSRIVSFCEPGMINDFVWEGLYETRAKSDMGAALKKLIGLISDTVRTKFSYLAPVIILFSASASTDDYRAALRSLNAKQAYKHATKIAFAIGDTPDLEMLSEITGSTETVITTVIDYWNFFRMFRFNEVEVDPVLHD